METIWKNWLDSGQLYVCMYVADHHNEIGSSCSIYFGYCAVVYFASKCSSLRTHKHGLTYARLQHGPFHFRLTHRATWKTEKQQGKDEREKRKNNLFGYVLYGTLQSSVASHLFVKKSECRVLILLIPCCNCSSNINEPNKKIKRRRWKQLEGKYWNLERKRAKKKNQVEAAE